jgi:multiple sugar transport system substrate-binding protein
MSKGALMSRRAVLTAAMLAAASCAGTTDPDSGTELVWITGGITVPDYDRAMDIATRWNQLRPNGPKVRVELLPLSTNEQHQILTLELNAGLGEFDILDLDVIWVPDFAQHGWLVDLQDLRPDIERVTLASAVQTGVWNGRLWAAPYVTDAGVLYYRSDLVDTPPATWEELIEVGRRVGERNGIAPFVADGAQYEGLVVQYLEYFWGLGGDVLGKDGQSVLFQPDKARHAAEFMWKAFHEGVYAPGFNTMKLEDARDAFQSGEAVFMRSWPYAYLWMNGKDPGSQVAGKVGIAPLPTFAGLGPVTALGGHNLAVSKFSANQTAAIEFVRFVATSRDVQLALAKRHSLAPTLKTVYHDVADDPMLALLAKALPTAEPRPATPEWFTISAELQQRIFTAYTSEREPEQALFTALREFLIATVQGH